MKGIKILSGILTGLGAVFTTVAANEEGVSKTEKTSNIIFGLSAVSAGICGVLAETAKEEREKREEAVKKIIETANKKKEEA